MRAFIVWLPILCATVSLAGAQSQKTSSSPPQSGAAAAPTLGSGNLRGVYGPPSTEAGHLRGVYGPRLTTGLPSTLPTSITGPNLSTSDTLPSVTVSGTAELGLTLPQGVTPSPMPDRPGFGRAIVNGRNAIVDTNNNQIVQFSD